jgi:hypothetical protein
MKNAVLKVRALWELVRYDVASAASGFRGAYRLLRPPVRKRERDGLESEIARAVDWASSLYWRRVRCLQRSVAATRLMRAYGIPAELVIGCQLAPFAGHAWVEVNGRILNGSVGLARQLKILDRV